MKRIFLLFILFSPFSFGQSIAFSPIEKTKSSSSRNSAALYLGDHILATVVSMHNDPQSAQYVDKQGNKHDLKLLTTDPNSRIALYTPIEKELDLGTVLSRGSSLNLTPSSKLFFPNGSKALLASRIFTFQGNILPLSVLRVNHLEENITIATPLFNEHQQCIGIFRQPAYNSKKSSYIIPAEALWRLAKDYKINHSIKRCWVGVLIDTSIEETPIVDSVRPGSPASKAGIKTGDIILYINARQTPNYPALVDAFYYLIEGKEATFGILRGLDILTFQVAPLPLSK